MDEIANLFVYGSLMSTGWNHRLIERYVRHAVTGTIRGILVNLGSFPALLPGDGLVRGVMLTVDAIALQITDRLEGIPSLYRRKETSVTLGDGNVVTAWVYEYSDPTRLTDRPRLLLSYDDGVPVYAWSPS